MSEVYEPQIPASPEVNREAIRRLFEKIIEQIELSDETKQLYLESERARIVEDRTIPWAD